MDGDRISGVGERLPLVLVVDDYADAQWAYGVWLRRAGYRVAFASSGEEALAQARQLQPDAVIMDLCLRGTDGWTAIRDLRADPRLEDVAILAVSGYAEPQHERLAYECGCDLFVTKSCPVETLASIVHGLLAKSAVMVASGARLRTAEAHVAHPSAEPTTGVRAHLAHPNAGPERSTG
jgi:CheY-like chemotaxis protein